MIGEYIYKGKKYFSVSLIATNRDGKRFQKRFRFCDHGNRIDSLRKARAFESKMLVEFKKEIELRSRNITFNDLFERFMDSTLMRFKKSTVLEYRGKLARWVDSSFMKTPILEITKELVLESVLEAIARKGGSLKTQDSVLKKVKKIMEYACQEEMIPINPAAGIKLKIPPPEKSVLNTEEAELLIKKSKEYDHPFSYLWAFALLTGMRNGELYALRWVDVDLVAGKITIQHSWTSRNGYHPPKSNERRAIPISDDLKKLLLELKDMGPFKENLQPSTIREKKDQCSYFYDDLVLPRLRIWRQGAQARVTRKFCQKIGISSVGFHDLRATFITNLLAQGVPLAKVMSIVGHARTSTTDEYLRLSGVNIKGFTDSLSYSISPMKEMHLPRTLKTLSA